MKKFLYSLVILATLLSGSAYPDGLSTTPGQRLHQGGAVLPVQGGTGIRSYAVGDTLYASATNTLVRLPDVATGSFFVSGGVNTAPAWTAASSLSPAFVGTNFTGTGASFTAGTANAVTDAHVSFTDITTGNSSTSNHGFLKKLSNTATQYMDGTGNWSTPASGGFTLGTATAFNSATTYNVTGLPAGIKQITMNLQGVTMSGAANILVQIGDASGGLKTSGYVGNGGQVSNAGGTSGTAFTTGIGFTNTTPTTVSGQITFNLIDATNFIWEGSAVLSSGTQVCFSATGVTLSAALDRITFTTAAGTATWTAGKINIFYQ